MAYSKQNFENGQVLEASQLEKIENAILDNEKAIENINISSDHAESSFNGQVISILGDSISTFAGYIPVADGHNLTHRARYPQSNLLTDVTLTWWHKLITNLGAKLGINDSWAGSRVHNSASSNSGDQGPDACMASITRISNLGSNGTPDIILFYGGTNDAGAGITIGTFDSTDNHTAVDLTATTWTSFADAYKTAIMRLQYYYPDSKIICLLPMWTTSYYTIANMDKYGEIVKDICDYFGVPVIDLRKCGINWQNKGYTLGDGIHPTALGMDLMEKYIRKQLCSYYEGNYTEHIVYTITNNLANAVNDDRYIKGVSAGEAYSATLSGTISNLVIIMNDVDITSTAFDAATNTINIPEVTGNIVISDTGNIDSNTVWYLDHRNNISSFTSSVNIAGRGWTYMETNPAYSAIINKPINTAAFFTTKLSQEVTITKMSTKDTSEGDIIATVTATIPSETKQLAVITFPEVTLATGEYLSLFSSDNDNINFYYSGSAVTDANNIKDAGFISRTPVVYGSGTPWQEFASGSLGWSFGYTTKE